jgi:hypothetical protein
MSKHTMSCFSKEEKDWYFTFGIGHEHDGQSMGNCYVVFHGTFGDAREKMIDRFGLKWAFQYGSAEKAGVERFYMRKVG